MASNVINSLFCNTLQESVGATNNIPKAAGELLSYPTSTKFSSIAIDMSRKASFPRGARQCFAMILERRLVM